MYTVLSGIVFFLVISDNTRMTYTQRGAPCDDLGDKKYRCQRIFQCEDKPPRKPTCRCPLEEPIFTGSQPDCRKARVGEECGLPFHCDTEVCTDNKCKCPPESPDYDSDLKMCKSKDKVPGKGKTNGEACAKDADCNAEFLLKCETSKCACPAKTEWKPGGCKPSKGKDKEGSAYGGPCDTAGDCMDGKGLTCTSKQCICEPGSIWDAGKCQKKETKPSFGGICAKDDDCDDKKSLVCFNKKCDCAVEFKWKADKCEKLKSIGEDCTTQEDCQDGQRLNCTNKKCACHPGYDWKKKGCEIGSARTINGTCSTDDHCIKERQLVCIKNKCDCKAGFDWIKGFCKPKKDREQCNPYAMPKDCQKGGMECHAKEKYCTCPVGSEFSIAAKYCKLQAGENCFINNTLQHDLCASQQCITESGKKHCACPQEDGVTQTWSSSSQDCITEYLNVPCAGSDDECRGGTVDPRRQSLICKNNICQCREGLTYLRGYCVLATLLFNEVCDPDGIGPTCRVDAELTCQDIGGGDKRCVCLLREIPVLGKKEIVALSWNADQKKCDLKPNGARCNGGYECRIGYCRETCQRGIVERPKSAQPKLTNYKIPTVLTFIFILILH